MNCKIGKKLGEGVNGTVYSGLFNNIPCILKIEKYDGDTSTKSSFIREQAFAEFAKDYPEYFMQLLYHGVIVDCDHIQPIPKHAKGEFKKMLINKNKLDKCSIMAYAPLLEYTWENKPKLSIKQYYKAVKDIVEGIDIMRSGGFEHTDIHSGNVMYDKKDKRWKIIDYGGMLHDSFEESKEDRMLDKAGQPTCDVLMTVWMILNNGEINHLNNIGHKYPTYKTFLKRVKENREFMKGIQKYLPKTTNVNILNDAITLLCVIKDIKFYIKCVGADSLKIVIPVHKQLNESLLIYIIQHSCDTTYTSILRYITALVKA
jgi:hypothetical protein